MLPSESLRDLLHQKTFTRLDKLLLCLAVKSETPKRPAGVRASAYGAGLRAAKLWNVSEILARSGGLATNTADGWVLTTQGREYVRKLAGPHLIAGPPTVSTSLRGHLAKLTDPRIASFVEEAIVCFEHRLYRSAAVLSWVGALALLYEHVVKTCLAAFNAEATRREMGKWKPAVVVDDLALMKEHSFLQILEHISVVGKSVKTELEARLKFRNGCGHPNTFEVAENMVAAHIESLIVNVFAKFTL